MLNSWEHPSNGHVRFPAGPPVIAFDLGGTDIRCVVLSSAGVMTDFEKDRIPSVPLGAEVTVESNSRRSDSPISRTGADRGGTRLTDRNLGSRTCRSRGNRLHRGPPIGDQCAEFPLGRLVRERTGRDCYVVNDVSAATWYLSNRITGDRFLVVTVSTGIGSKLFDRDRRDAVLDSTGYAGEIGHVTVDSRTMLPSVIAAAVVTSAASLPAVA